MSLVGCSEPEMANVLQGLGYRVHPPSEENGPLYAFSIKPRFVREREEQRERERLQQRQQREQREQRRRERPERPNERQFFADSARPGTGKDERRRGGPAQEGPRQDGAPNKGAPNKGPPPEGHPPRADRPGPRPPRRHSGGPAPPPCAPPAEKCDAP